MYHVQSFMTTARVRTLAYLMFALMHVCEVRFFRKECRNDPHLIRYALNNSLLLSIVASLVVVVVFIHHAAISALVIVVMQ